MPRDRGCGREPAGLAPRLSDMMPSSASGSASPGAASHPGWHNRHDARGHRFDFAPLALLPWMDLHRTLPRLSLLLAEHNARKPVFCLPESSEHSSSIGFSGQCCEASMDVGGFQGARRGVSVVGHRRRRASNHARSPFHGPGHVLRRRAGGQAVQSGDALCLKLRGLMSPEHTSGQRGGAWPGVEA